MNKFSKLIFILLVGYPLYFFSFLLSRKKKRWVFGAGQGFHDNGKYLFLNVFEHHKDIDAAWVSKNKALVEQLRQKNIPAYHLYSWAGIKYLFTANQYVLANYPSIMKDISLPLWTIGRAKYIQLWHGVGIKKVLFARENDVTVERLKHPLKKYFWLPIIYNTLKKPDLFLSTSPQMTEHFMQCFQLKKEAIVESAYPRCEVFSQTNNDRYMSLFADTKTQQLYQQFKKHKKVFIYMPTFRENNPYYLDEAGFDYQQLNSAMKSMDALFVFKLHPWSKVSLPEENTTLKNILFLDANTDVYPLLPHTEALITDYSSIYYDYLLMDDKFTVFFDYDRDQYLNERDIAFDFDEHTEGIKVKTFQQLLDSLISTSYKKIDKQKAEKIKEMFWGKTTNHQHLIRAIKALENNQ